MKVKTAAKVNLALDVTGKLPNGYHTIESVFQTVGLYDEISVELTEKGITLSCEVPEQFAVSDHIPCDERNIAYKAAKLFFEENDMDCGCNIHIKKGIPSQAGMGGGSTDAAAVLYCLGRLTGTSVSKPEKLGADVPFFLTGGGSVHQVLGEMDFYFINYEKMTMDEIYALLERYFKEVFELSRTNLFDVIGHITYCLRYMKQRHGIEADISRYDDIIEETFRNLAYNGKGIEINTSGLRQGFGDCFPNLKYARMYRNLGGEIITVGSDSHTVEDIAANTTEGIEIARAAGFTRLAYFKKRQPYFIDIE